MVRGIDSFQRFEPLEIISTGPKRSIFYLWAQIWVTLFDHFPPNHSSFRHANRKTNHFQTILIKTVELPDHIIIDLLSFGARRRTHTAKVRKVFVSTLNSKHFLHFNLVGVQ